MLRSLPFTHDRFFDVFEAYNEALWPFALTLWLGSLATLVWCLRSPYRADKSINILLAIHWAWVALAYHMAFFSAVNPAAWLFAGLFLIQASLFARYGLARGRLKYSSGRSTRHILSWAVVVYAMVYPAIASLQGLSFPRMPTFGIPCPTAILTIGLLVMADRPLPRRITIIPILWGLIGGSAAFLLGVFADFMLLAAGIGFLVYTLLPTRSRY